MSFKKKQLLLEELASLRDENIISEGEFQQKKKILLDKI